MHHIVMGDVVGSSDRDPRDIALKLKSAIDSMQSRYDTRIISPLTITLGDEFQGVVDSHGTAVALTLDFLRLRLNGEIPFPMRFSVVTGEIDTPINTKIAHEMIGAGLTTARRGLTDKDRDRANIFVSLPDTDMAGAMQNAFDILYRRTEDWVGDQGMYLHDLTDADWDAEVIAKEHDRQKPTVYRRRRSDAVLDYIAATRTVTYLASLADRLEAA